MIHGIKINYKRACPFCRESSINLFGFCKNPSCFSYNISQQYKLKTREVVPKMVDSIKNGKCPSCNGDLIQMKLLGNNKGRLVCLGDNSDPGKVCHMYICEFSIKKDDGIIDFPFVDPDDELDRYMQEG